MFAVTEWWVFSFLIILGSAVSLAQTMTSDNSITIIVDGSTAGGNTLCPNEVICVTNFNMALRKLENMNYANILIQVSPGNYTLENGTENEITCYQENSALTISTGINSTEHAILDCEPAAGIHIYNCSNVTLELITLNQCGYDPHKVPLFTYASATLTGRPLNASPQPAAVVIFLSHYISLASITILNSQGSGLLLHSYEATISDCIVTGGREIVSTEDSISGGIVLHNFYSQEHPAFSRVLITRSQITNNNYSSTSGAGLTVLELPSVLEVETSVITSNSLGLLVYNYKSTDENFTDILTLNNVYMLQSPSAIFLANSTMHLNLYNIFIYEWILVDQQHYYQLELDSYSYNIRAEPVSLAKSLTTSIICTIYCVAPLIQFTYSYIPNVINETYRILPGICSNDENSEDLTAGKCPISYSAKMSISIEETNEYGKNNVGITKLYYTCWGNRHGDLCGECIEGHSVAINSPYLSCVPCNGSDAAKGWGLLIAFEFIPVTVMVAVIALLNVNLNQGSLNAYIFFCQILTIPFPSVSYPSWLVVNYNFNYRIFDFLVYPFSAIWNLGFIIYPSYNLYNNSNDTWFGQAEPSTDHPLSICISPHTTALGAISFWYLIAFYPFLMLFLIYLCVICYNRGYRCVVCIIRPIHRLLARFWRMFNIQPSLPTTIASVYTLCFTQLAATSLKLLHGTSFKNKTVFFYDGSQPYFQGAHGAAATLALIVLIVFIIVPVVYLSVYPFKWFQSCLNRVKIRKDLLISVTDVFTAPYGNGMSTDKKWDYRYFAGMHFIFQLVAMCCYYVTDDIPAEDLVSYLIQPFQFSGILIIAAHMLLCIIMIILLVMFRPYRRMWHTFTDVAIMLTLFFSSFFSILFYFFKPSLYTGIGIIYLYMLITICYCIYQMFKKCKTARNNIYQRRFTVASSQSTGLVEQEMNAHNDDDDDDEFDADRMLNPAEYEHWEDSKHEQ